MFSQRRAGADEVDVAIDAEWSESSSPAIANLHAASSVAETCWPLMGNSARLQTSDR